MQEGVNKGEDMGIRSMNPTTKEIIKQWLIDNGYDGLYCEDCGCFLDDLFPCGDIGCNCKAGYASVICKDDEIISVIVPDNNMDDCPYGENRYKE